MHTYLHTYILTYIHTYIHTCKGSIPDFLGSDNLKLSTIYLNFNNFNGTISQSFSNLQDLSVLALYNNELTGTIPEFLGDLGEMEVMQQPAFDVAELCCLDLSSISLIYIFLTH